MLDAIDGPDSEINFWSVISFSSVLAHVLISMHRGFSAGNRTNQSLLFLPVNASPRLRNRPKYHFSLSRPRRQGELTDIYSHRDLWLIFG